MDIKAVLDEISRIEKEKAQLELRQSQLAEKQDALAKRLAALGVSPRDLDTEVSRLESSIREKLDAIRSGPAKTATVKSKNITPDDDIMSAIGGDEE